MTKQKIAKCYELGERRREQKLYTVYEALDTKRNDPVSVSILSAVARGKPLEILLRYRKIRENLLKVKHPNLQQVLEVGEEAAPTSGSGQEILDYTVYEDAGHQTLRELQPSDSEGGIRIILGIALGLAAAHEARILHGAINPANILIQEEVGGQQSAVREERFAVNGQQSTVGGESLLPTANREPRTVLTPKLTCFGLNLLIDLTKVNTPEEIREVFGYLAPEATGILKKPIDKRSDLYSLGVLFYELLTGRLPYESTEVAELIHQHIAQSPTTPSQLNPDIPPVIEKIVLRLIAKDPLERYQSASGLIYDLEEYRRRVKELAPDALRTAFFSIDFEIAREDRIKELNFSTRLIGREKELSELKSYLEQSAKQGQGKACLIHGETGVGKSRLVDELRSAVHSRHGIFAGGKCEQYAFATPYKVMIEALEVWIDKVKRLSQKEQESQVKRLKEGLGQLGGEVVKLTPRIKELIGEPEALVALDSPEKEKIRFLITMSDFIANMGSQENPLLILLDDLQWVDEGTLEILERVIPKTKEKPITLIISYRSTEVGEKHILTKMLNKCKEQNPFVVSGSSLAEKNTEAEALSTNDQQPTASGFIATYPILPFNTTETAQLLSQILLESTDNILRLAEYLHERTQGNPLFTLELLRTLYEEKLITLSADQHYIYNVNSLKQAVLPTNVVDIVLKRVKDISPTDKQILSYASVMGKEINMELLSKLTHKDLNELMNTVEGSISNQLLYRDLTGQEEVYFIHDRVRESFYGTLTQEEKIPLHKQIAESIETQHKDDIDKVIYDLAYHYTQGQVEEKALIYSIQGGDKARKSYSNELAIRLYTTAKEILDKQKKATTPEYIDLLENLGEVYRLTGRFEQSLQNLRTCEGLIPREESLHRVRIMSKMGDTFFDSGKTEESANILEKALKLLKVRVPGSQIGVFFGIGIQFTIQMLHWVLPKIFIKDKFVATEQQLVIVRILNRVAHYYYLTNMYKAFYTGLRAINLVDLCGPCQEMAYGYVTMVAAWGVLPFRARMERDFKKGIALCQKLGDIIHEGGGYAYYAVFCYVNNRPKEGIEYARKAIDILKTRGEYWDLGLGYVFRNTNSSILGRLKETVLENKELITMMKSANALQPLGWGLFAKGKIHYTMGNFYEGIVDDIKKGCEIMEITRDKANLINSQGILSFLHTRMKNYPEALKVADKVCELFPTHYNKGPWCLEALTYGAQAYLDCIANTPDLSSFQKKEYLRQSRWFIFNARCYSLPIMFPFFRGWMYQVWGTYNWLSGRKCRAEKLWDKGLHWLRTNKNNPGGDKYRIGYLLLEEAKFLLQDNPQSKKAYTNLLEAKELFEGMGCVLDLQTTTELLAKLTPEGIMIDSRAALSQKRHFESLLNVSAAIGSIFDLNELLDKIMEYAIKVTGAERGFLLLYREDRRQGSESGSAEKVLELKVSRGVKKDETVDSSSETGEKEITAQSFSYERYGISLNIIKQTVEKKEAQLVEASDKEIEEQAQSSTSGKVVEEEANSKQISEELKSYQVKEALCLPLEAREKLLGVLYLDNRLAGGTFSHDEVELMKAFSVQSAISIENTRLVGNLVEQERLKQELELGREIQKNLLPQETPQIEGLQVAGLMLPAKEIGGDYYDFLDLSARQKLGIVIGDVSGKGVGAGLIMATAKSTIEAITRQDLTPKEILATTNELLGKYTKGEKFMTMLYLEWDALNKKMRYSSAGHEHIIIYRSKAGSQIVDSRLELVEKTKNEQVPATNYQLQTTNSPCVEVIPSGGIVLGMLPEIEEYLEDKELQLNVGDKIVLYTDGITEAHNEQQEMYELARLAETVKRHGHKPCGELLSSIKEDVFAFIGGAEQFDDITLVVMDAIDEA